MNLRTLVWRELWERKNQLATSFIAIAIGAAAIVAVHNIAFYSQKKVKSDLETLGANILILPQGTVVSDYYTADMDGKVMSASVVDTLRNAGLEGLDNMSPKLSTIVELDGREVTLTGILPKSEIQAKAVWGGVQTFNPLASCAGKNEAATALLSDKEKLAQKRFVQDLGENEVFLGADVASRHGIDKGEALTLGGRAFTVREVLPSTGRPDDGRIFGHLGAVQALAGKGDVVNVVEVMGCCQQVQEGMVGKLQALLPNHKIETVNDVLETQISTNKLMGKLVFLFLGLMILVGGASIATYMYANVHERRREIGTMMALGATTGTLQAIFMVKALLLGVAGGVVGYAIGTGLAVGLGPSLAGVPVLPLPMMLVVAVGVSAGLALLASWLPARRAARLDPFMTLREV